MIDPAYAVRATASTVRERCAADAVSPHRRPTGCGVGDAADGVKRGWGAPRLNQADRRMRCGVFAFEVLPKVTGSYFEYGIDRNEST